MITTMTNFRALIERMREHSPTKLVQARELHAFADELEPFLLRFAVGVADGAMLDRKLILIGDTIHKGGDLRKAINDAIDYEDEAG